MWPLIAGVMTAIAIGTTFMWWSCRRELKLWAHLANNSRILLSVKNRIMVHYPLTEWMKWAQMLNEDEKSTGRVIYRNAHVVLRLAGPSAVRQVQAPEPAQQAAAMGLPR